MTINERIKAAVEPIVPVCEPDMYGGDEEQYCTFNYNVRGDLFSDDAPSYDIFMVQVHLFAPYKKNTVGTRKAIKQALFSGGFTWPTEMDAGSEYSSEKVGQHIVFECETVEGIENG